MLIPGIFMKGKWRVVDTLRERFPQRDTLWLIEKASLGEDVFMPRRC